MLSFNNVLVGFVVLDGCSLLIVVPLGNTFMPFGVGSHLNNVNDLNNHVGHRI